MINLSTLGAYLHPKFARYMYDQMLTLLHAHNNSGKGDQSVSFLPRASNTKFNFFTNVSYNMTE